MVAFNYVTMGWVVVSRVRMDKQDASAYGLAYSTKHLPNVSQLTLTSN